MSFTLPFLPRVQGLDGPVTLRQSTDGQAALRVDVNAAGSRFFVTYEGQECPVLDAKLPDVRNLGIATHGGRAYYAINVDRGDNSEIHYGWVHDGNCESGVVRRPGANVLLDHVYATEAFGSGLVYRVRASGAHWRQSYLTRFLSIERGGALPDSVYGANPHVSPAGPVYVGVGPGTPEMWHLVVPGDQSYHLDTLGISRTLGGLYPVGDEIMVEHTDGGRFYLDRLVPTQNGSGFQNVERLLDRRNSFSVFDYGACGGRSILVGILSFGGREGFAIVDGEVTSVQGVDQAYIDYNTCQPEFVDIKSRL